MRQFPVSDEYLILQTYNHNKMIKASKNPFKKRKNLHGSLEGVFKIMCGIVCANTLFVDKKG